MTNDLLSRYISNWETVKEIKSADPDFNKPTQVDLIIGAGHYEDLVGNNRLKEPNIPVTYRLSVFGWLVIGRENVQTYNSSHLQTYFVSSFEDSLQRFREIKCLQLNTWPTKKKDAKNTSSQPHEQILKEGSSYNCRLRKNWRTWGFKATSTTKS